MNPVAEKFYADVLDVPELPNGDWILPIVKGRNVGSFLYRIADPISGETKVTGWSPSLEHARARQKRHYDRRIKFWEEKIHWKDNGDWAPLRGRQSGPRNVLRAGGYHYIVKTFGVGIGLRKGKGMGGQVFRWRFLDEGPDGRVYESDNVFCQGAIPPEFREDLPDNVAWVGDNYAIPGQR